MVCGGGGNGDVSVMACNVGKGSEQDIVSGVVAPIITTTLDHLGHRAFAKMVALFHNNKKTFSHAPFWA